MFPGFCLGYDHWPKNVMMRENTGYGKALCTTFNYASKDHLRVHHSGFNSAIYRVALHLDYPLVLSLWLKSPWAMASSELFFRRRRESPMMAGGNP